MDFNIFKEKIENLNFDLEKFGLSDGRLESALAEKNIYNFLKEELFKNDIDFKEAPADRYWYDCCYNINDEFAPINIKITSGNSADNISSKEGMYYALTGLNPKEVKGEGNLNHYENFITSLLKHKQLNNKDYYFIIYFKNINKFFVTSLKRIEMLVPNPRNLPYQCNWSKNLTFTNRSSEEQDNYILKTFITSYKGQVKGLDQLLEWEKNN